MTPRVHLALRFHVNLYHSYRGDSLDEKGIGKDLRLLRANLDALDRLNADGIPVRAAWDIENHYSLERYLPRFGPDIVARIRARIADGRDEAEAMSWNNGFATAHTSDELEMALRWAVSNPEGSGLADRFGSCAPIVRPQECTFSATQIPVFRRAGMEAVSVYYSACPFDGFGAFVPRLDLVRRFNPLAIADPGSGETLRLLPAVSPVDVLEQGGSLRGWLRRLRRAQRRLAQPRDLLLLLDMDADDTFWEGFLPRGFAFLAPSLCGLEALVRSVADLPWLTFATPGEYLRTHADAGTVAFGQDLADGSFDGCSSWSEKAENVRLWTVIAAARRPLGLAEAVAREGGVEGDDRVAAAVVDARAALLLALSTTHFGMASPVMNVDRMRNAFERTEAAAAAAKAALRIAHEAAETTGRPVAPRLRRDPRIEGDAAGEPTTQTSVRPPPALEVGPDSVRSGSLALRVLPDGGVEATRDGAPLFDAPLSRPWVRYGGRMRGSRGRAASAVVETRDEDGRRVGVLRAEGAIRLPRASRADGPVRWTHEYVVDPARPGFRVDVSVSYPHTEHRGYKRGRAVRLGRTWDARWREVAPFELQPALGATADDPAMVWKHGYDDRVGSYAIDRHRFGPDRSPDSLDNHVTDGWVAVSGPVGGLLVAQSDEAQTLFAFCPMRVRLRRGRQSVRLNPFGSYHGRQNRHPIGVTGLGRLAAIAFGDEFDPYAASWEGETLRISLWVVPYAGGRPPEELQRDALRFAYRPVTG